MDTVEFFSEISIPLSFTAECAENAEASEKTSMGTVEFFSKFAISLNFTAECAETAEAPEKTSNGWNRLKLCALGDFRVDKSLLF